MNSWKWLGIYIYLWRELGNFDISLLYMCRYIYFDLHQSTIYVVKNVNYVTNLSYEKINQMNI